MTGRYGVTCLGRSFRNKRNDRSLAGVKVRWATMAAPLL